MTLSTFDEYYDFYAPKMEKYPQRDDFMRVLEWAADKPGHECDYGDLALILDPDKKPNTEEMMSRVMAITVILTGWRHPIAAPFFKVKSENGKLYEVGAVERPILDGEKSYVLNETGETIDDFPARAYMHFRFKDFEPRRQPAAAPSSGPSV